MRKQPTKFPMSVRVPTGALQFGNDWPGVFIRGDDALSYAFALRRAGPQIDEGCARLVELADLLASCRVIAATK